MEQEELKGLPLFQDVPTPVMGLVAQLLKKVSFEPGETIFEEGSEEDTLYIIRTGEVEVRKVTDRKSGKHKLVAVLVRGEFFGEMAVFLGHPRSADAVARTPVDAVTISRAEITALFARSPESAMKVMEFLASALMRRLQNTTRELVTVHETGRLITTTRSMPELADCVMKSMTQAVPGVDAALFVIWNEFNSEYDVVRQHGLGLEPGTVIAGDDPLVVWLKEHAEAMLSPDLASEERFQPGPGSLYDTGSMVAAPFFVHDRMLGFMAAMNTAETNAFFYNHMILLSAISSYVSVAVQNLQHMQEAIDRSRLDQAKSSIQY